MRNLRGNHLGPFLLVALMGCLIPSAHEPPPDLNVALGAVDHRKPDGGSARPGELLTYDLEPLFQARLPDPATTVPAMLRRLPYSRIFAACAVLTVLAAGA